MRSEWLGVPTLASSALFYLADVCHCYLVHSAAGQIEPAVAGGRQVAHHPAARRDVPLLKVAGFGVETHQRVRLHAGLAVPHDSIARDGNAMWPRLRYTRRQPLFHCSARSVRAAEVAALEVGV